ncbi:hypothetical protein BCIN_03g08940 [Botrytis cinerea B05.10]|uniref:Uncharacterized protein n=1 Tax=Botryotinia fuckeliana (strain B05.10) TaxID=332648 RepID=A0A384JE35_BOTFB|nr:hypothetical protein BCIN_03g08940 [Botrytis cinerea B05.10]ATZ48711.1 hypothetical protein BCIN_03g08940 [Botrytis cinerea B05.10]
MGPFELVSKYIAEQKEREKHEELTHKHGMKLSSKSGFPHASNSNSNSDSPQTISSTAPNTPRPNTPSRSACSTRFATLDETARLQQQKIAEWTVRNLANKAQIKEAEAEAEAEAESKTEE